MTILLAEDDDGHAELVRGHLIDVGVSNPVIRFTNGEDAWNFLARIGELPHREESKAYLLLLDIRMPKMDGVELLRRIKDDATLQTMPVIMLTTTNDPREIKECYSLGCNSYVSKPVNHRNFAEVLRQLGLFIMIIHVAPIEENQ